MDYLYPEGHQFWKFDGPELNPHGYPSVPAPVSALFPETDALMESSTEGSDLAFTRECFYNPRRGAK